MKQLPVAGSSVVRVGARYITNFTTEFTEGTEFN